MRKNYKVMILWLCQATSKAVCAKQVKLFHFLPHYFYFRTQLISHSKRMKLWKDIGNRGTNICVNEIYTAPRYLPNQKLLYRSSLIRACNLSFLFLYVPSNNRTTEKERAWVSEWVSWWGSQLSNAFRRAHSSILQVDICHFSYVFDAFLEMMALLMLLLFVVVMILI